MAKGLNIGEPPRRPVASDTAAPVVPIREKFEQGRPSDKVQFNKRVSSEVAEGFEMLAIRTRRKVPDLLAEALALLQERYGKV
jgi:hypothetical protein